MAVNQEVQELVFRADTSGIQKSDVELTKLGDRKSTRLNSSH